MKTGNGIDLDNLDSSICQTGGSQDYISRDALAHKRRRSASSTGATKSYSGKSSTVISKL